MNKDLALLNDLVYTMRSSPRNQHEIIRLKVRDMEQDDSREEAVPGLKDRRKALFGVNYDHFMKLHAGDPVIGEILICDAIRTGHWRELPEPLLTEYQRRMNAVANKIAALKSETEKESDE